MKDLSKERQFKQSRRKVVLVCGLYNLLGRGFFFQKKEIKVYLG